MSRTTNDITPVTEALTAAELERIEGGSGVDYDEMDQVFYPRATSSYAPSSGKGLAEIAVGQEPRY